MERVVQRVINDRYIPFTPIKLVVGTTLPFDCYIKRYGDYVIIIEANTLLTSALMEKILHQDMVYVHIHDSMKFNTYLEEHSLDHSNETLANDEIIRNALDLPRIVEALPTDEEKLQAAYQNIASLMRVIFEAKMEKLPLDALYSSLQVMVQLAKNGNLMSNLCSLTPNEYSTHAHSTNVGFFSVFLASAMNFSEDDLFAIAYAGLLHDIGKLKIDMKLLLKPERLTDDEYELIKEHSDYGYEIVQQNGITNQSILNGIQFHHEKLDGSGYPKQLRGKMIPKYARIIGLCDAFDALTVKRTFRKSYTSYEALKLIKQEMANQFDELYVNMLIQKLR